MLISFNQGIFCISDIKEYLSNYADADPAHLVMEKSPNYFGSPIAPKQIAEFNPESFVIFSMRDPFHRTVSDFLQKHTTPPNDFQGDLNVTIEDYLTDDDGELKIGLNDIDNSIYEKHLRTWLEYFDRDQILVRGSSKKNKSETVYFQCYLLLSDY